MKKRPDYKDLEGERERDNVFDAKIFGSIICFDFVQFVFRVARFSFYFSDRK